MSQCQRVKNVYYSTHFFSFIIVMCLYIYANKQTHTHTHTVYVLCVYSLFIVNMSYFIYTFLTTTTSLFFHFHFHSLKTDPTGKEGVKAKLADLVEIMQPKADVPIQQPAPVGRRF